MRRWRGCLVWGLLTRGLRKLGGVFGPRQETGGQDGVPRSSFLILPRSSFFLVPDSPSCQEYATRDKGATSSFLILARSLPRPTFHVAPRALSPRAILIPHSCLPTSSPLR